MFGRTAVFCTSILASWKSANCTALLNKHYLTSSFTQIKWSSKLVKTHDCCHDGYLHLLYTVYGFHVSAVVYLISLQTDCTAIMPASHVPE